MICTTPGYKETSLSIMNRTLFFWLTLAIALSIFFGSSRQAAIAEAESEMENTTHSLSTSEDWYFESGQDGAELGYSVSSAGDVNGDGFADIVIGSPLYTPATPEGIYREGAAFAFYGGSGGLAAFPDWQASGGKQGCRFGNSVSSAGDVNGDGFDDVIIGAEEYKLAFAGYVGEPKSGMAFLYLGSAAGLAEAAAWVQPAEAAEIAFGFAVASAGDVNADGFDDVIIGAPYYESGSDQINEGKVYVFLGSAAGLKAVPDWAYECNLASSSCGYAVSSAGDVNHDGYADVIVGAPHYDNPAANAGAALLFYGSAQGLGDTATWITGNNQAAAWFGEAVAAAGDVNQDGFEDLVIGASHFDPEENQIDYGAAFLYLGSPSGPRADFDWAAYGSEQYSGFGRSVRAAGDINLDGYADVLVGAYLFGENGSLDQPDEGAVYLFMGGSAGLKSPSNWAAFGDKAEAWFGFSGGIAGDINGDGGNDILVGAPKYRFDEKTVMGRAFVFLNTLEGFNYQVFIPLLIR